MSRAGLGIVPTPESRDNPGSNSFSFGMRDDIWGQRRLCCPVLCRLPAAHTPGRRSPVDGGCAAGSAGKGAGRRPEAGRQVWKDLCSGGVSWREKQQRPGESVLKRSSAPRAHRWLPKAAVRLVQEPWCCVHVLKPKWTPHPGGAAASVTSFLAQLPQIPHEVSFKK